jgi:colanic acid biosynthesis glycosyl transferase WcaI
MGQSLTKATGFPKKRVLVVTQHFWPESFRINDICNFLTEDKNCEVDVLCGIPNYPLGKFFEGYSYFKNKEEIYNNINIKRVLEIPRGNNSTLRIFVNYISFPIFSIFYIPRLLTKKYDKILLYQLSPVIMSFAGIIVGKIKKIETTMYVLDLWPENLFSVLDINNTFLRKLVTKISHWHYKKTDKLIALSEKMKMQLLNITGKDDSQVIILPQACEKLYENDINDKSLQNRFAKGFNIVYAGNISPAQSFETILTAAEILKERETFDINWIIVGDGMSRKWLEKEVEKNGLKDIFYFEGQKPVKDIPRYTTMADALIGCLTKSELLEATIPAKVMSYIAAGKPIVLAMDGEVQDLINNTIACGFVGETENAQILAENIKKLYDLKPVERRNMGIRARRYHFEHFERNLILTKLYDFIFTSGRL